MAAADVQLVCLDIDGTVADGVTGPALPGAAAAVQALRRRFPVRFVTNATSRPRREVIAALARNGLLVDPGELVTPAETARALLPGRGHHRGILLADPGAREDFGWFEEQPGGPAVLLASELHDATIASLQPAFRALLAGAAFYTAQSNRYFRQGGELVTDLGPVVSFLGYASGRAAENLGKPSPLVFDAIAAAAGLPRAALLMAGDDAEFDASGAVALGLGGILVMTGKYRPGDEERVQPRPSAVLESIADLPGLLGV